MALIFVIILVLIIIGLYLQYKKMSYWKDHGVPQMNPLYAVYYNWFIFFKPLTMVEFIMDLASNFPDARYFGYYIFGRRALYLHDVELVKQITIKDADHFTDRTEFIPEEIDPLWGKNLFALQGQRWRDMRVTLSPSFTSSKIKEMFVLMDQCAQKIPQHYLAKGEKLIKSDFKDIFTRYCADIIASVAFGVEVDSLKNPDNEFYKYAMDIADFKSFWKSFKFMGYWISPTLYRLLGLKFFSDDVANFYRNIINEGVKLREEKGLVRHDLIHLLLEARKGLEMKESNDIENVGFAAVSESMNGKIEKSKTITNEDITAQALVFFFAGFDSVSNAMCFMAQEIVEHPDVQDRLREEILETFEDSEGTLKYDAVAKMKYMDMVVSETLRKWPVNVGFDRVCSKPYKLDAAMPGYEAIQLKKGDTVAITSLSFHRNPKYFPDPDRFDPERFSDENKHNLNQYAYTPFGIGMRNCIGSRFALLEIKVIFFYLLKSFEIVPVEETCIPLRLQNTKMGIVPVNGFHFGLKRITN